MSAVSERDGYAVQNDVVGRIKAQGRKSIARYLLLMVGWLVVVLLVAELLVRMLLVNQLPHYITIPGWTDRPAPGTAVVWGTEGYGVTHYGQHGEIVTPSSVQGGASVVILGDSHTEAWQVSDNTKYTEVAAAQMKRDGIPANFHNMGANGTSLADYIYVAPFVHDTFAPKVVVVQTSVRDFIGNAGFGKGLANRFEVGADGTLQVIHKQLPKQGGLITPLAEMSALVNFTRQRVKELIREDDNTGDDAEATIVPTGDTKLHPQSLGELQALQTAYPDAKIVVLLLPSMPVIRDGTLVTEDQATDKLYDLLTSVPGWQVVYPKDQFNALGLSGTMPRGFSNTRPGLGHLNKAGHEAAGSLLAPAIEEALK